MAHDWISTSLRVVDRDRARGPQTWLVSKPSTRKRATTMKGLALYFNGLEHAISPTSEEELADGPPPSHGSITTST